jgi:hypothetical protein
VSSIAAFANRRPWLVRLVLAANCLALLATSQDEPGGVRALRKDLPAVSTELTPAISTRVYRVTLRAVDADTEATTRNAKALFRGTISIADLPQGSPAPYVSCAVLSSFGANLGEPVYALTDFAVEAQVGFIGPSTSFDVELSRADDGANGGTLTVDWSIVLSSVIVWTGDDPKTQSLPWEATVEEL